MSGIRWLRAGLDTCYSVGLRPIFSVASASSLPRFPRGEGWPHEALSTSFRAAAAASLILLSACASKPAIEVRTVRVEVPVPIPCVVAADIPERPGLLPPRPADARQALDLAVAKVLGWQAYGEKADAVLRGCAE